MLIILLLTQLGIVFSENSLFRACHPVLLPMDVLFLLDGSGSVSGNTFEMQMKMLRHVADLMRLEEKKSRLAVMQYAGYTRLEIPFGHNRTKEEVMSSLEQIHYMSGSTKTGKALKKARDILKEERNKKGKSHVKQVAIVVSDGHSHDDPTKHAAALRSDGVSLVVLGIGHHINREELLQITASEEYAFQNLHKQEELQNFVKSFGTISQEIECDFARHGDSIHYDTILTVKYSDCGVQTTITERSLLYSATVILQFNDVLATEQDITYTIRCIKDDQSSHFRALGEDYHLPPPPCRYTVRPLDNCNNIVLNSRLLHSWHCNYDDVVATVHLCEMVEPISRQSYKLLDDQGCPTSKFLSTVNQTSALLSMAVGSAVRFGSSPLVFFRCTLKLCRNANCIQSTNCRRKREISNEKEIDYEYNEEFPSVETRKYESTVAPLSSSTPGRALVKPLDINKATIFPGVDVLVTAKRLGIVEGQKPAKEVTVNEEGLPSVEKSVRKSKEEDKKALELIVFSRNGDFEKVTPRIVPSVTTITKTSTTETFPTLVTESTTPEIPEVPWEVDIVVETEPLLIRLPHESFTTTCNRN